MTAATHSEDALVLRQVEANVATLTLNRPKQYNALSQAMLAALQTELDAVAVDGAIRVVVIAGSGSAFCAGHDLKEMRAHADPAFHRDLFAQCGRVMLTINRLPQPVMRFHRRADRLATGVGEPGGSARPVGRRRLAIGRCHSQQIAAGHHRGQGTVLQAIGDGAGSGLCLC